MVGALQQRTGRALLVTQRGKESAMEIKETTMKTPKELATEYTKKLDNLFEELTQTEKESKVDERDQVYAQSQTRIHRLIDNYFKKLRPAKDHE